MSRRVAKLELLCQQCGNAFLVVPSKRGKRFCSNVCRAANLTNRIACTCKVCGKPLLRPPARLRRYHTVYCSIACRNSDPDFQAHLVEMNQVQQQLHPNRLEQRGYALLDEIGVPYEAQYLIRDWICVDAFVPSARLVIQWDGDYWHGNPRSFPTLDPRQQHRRLLDKCQDAYMTRCGYQVLRFWEYEVHNHPEEVAYRIRAVLGVW